MITQDRRKLKYVGIRVQPELHERFTLAAKANNRSLEGELRTLMEQRVKEFEAEATEAA